MENLARIIELWTKIPASKIQAQEFEQLRSLDERLKKRIVGQDEAIAAVSAANAAKLEADLEAMEESAKALAEGASVEVEATAQGKETEETDEE
jgi:ATP-dependent Clp protease ATP-binding subunit ClpA